MAISTLRSRKGSGRDAALLTVPLAGGTWVDNGVDAGVSYVEGVAADGFGKGGTGGRALLSRSGVGFLVSGVVDDGCGVVCCTDFKSGCAAVTSAVLAAFNTDAAGADTGAVGVLAPSPIFSNHSGLGREILLA